MKTSTITMYKAGEIVLISFPFSDLRITKIRPALIITQIKDDIIFLGIFSKIPDSPGNSWVLLDEETDWFKQTGLKKKSLVKTEKIAVIHSSLVKKKNGNLPDNILDAVKEKLRNTLKI